MGLTCIYGELQTPRKTVAVQVLRNTRFVEEVRMNRPARTSSAQERYARRSYVRLSTAAAPAVVDVHERARNPRPTRKGGGDSGIIGKRWRVAILWRGDHETRRAATPYNSRHRRVFEELIALGIDAQPVVYADDIRRRGAQAASDV